MNSLHSSNIAASDAIALERRYCAHNYDPLPVMLVRAQGAFAWDEQGRRYLDMMSAYSAVSHGHSHPRLVRALTQQAEKLAITSRAFYTDQLGPFLEYACTLTGMEAALPMNTGVEAVETAIKAVRKWGYERKGIADGQAEIIACEGNFHGRTLGAVSLSTEPQYRAGFGPLMGGMRTVPFGDTRALEQAIGSNTAAFIVEPIQGEAGIRVPPVGYLARCAEICRKHRVLFIADEIQSGLGRAGNVLAIEHENVKPDVVLLGKSLGGGLLPVSLVLASREVLDVFRPGDHGSTFGGNALAAAVGLEALKTLVDERLCERSAELGAYFMARLKEIQSPAIREVRGRGLWIGIDIDPAVSGARKIAERLLARGILTKETHQTVIRLAPPLIIEREQLDWCVEQLREIFWEKP
jgi:ornithine--oxo-acid transaminase